MSLSGGFGLNRSKSKKRERSKFERKGVQKERLDISQEGMDKIIQDVLGQAGGLASIFAGEQATGLYDSTVANQAAGDLAARVAGELAKLTAERIVTTKEKGKGTGTTSGKATSLDLTGEGTFGA